MLLSLDLNVADKFNWFIINLTKQSIFELTNKKFAFGFWSNLADPKNLICNWESSINRNHFFIIS